MTTTELRWGSATDVGRIRSNNEDQLLVAAPLFAVADGMGGHERGEDAAEMAVSALNRAFVDDPTSTGLVRAVKAANRAVFKLSEGDSPLRRMGTTLTAVALVDDGDGEHLAVANVGDSRTYLFRNGELEQLTEDHNVPGELLREGLITRAEAARHPQKNRVTRNLGVPEDVEVDILHVDPVAGDRLLLASDGLFDEVDDDGIAAILRRVADPDEATAALVAAARENGGSDNITVVLVEVVTAPAPPAGGPPTAPAAATKSPTTSQAPAPTRKGSGDAGGQPTKAAGPVPTLGPPPAKGLHLPSARVVAFVVAIVLILGTAVGVVSWYARGEYHVGLDGTQVAVFRGQPDGFLWLAPRVVERARLQSWEVPPARLADLQRGKALSSLEDARRYIANLEDEAAALKARSTTTTAPSIVSTTVTTSASAPTNPTR